MGDVSLTVTVQYGTDQSPAAVKAALLKAWAYIIKEEACDDRNLRPPVG